MPAKKKPAAKLATKKAPAAKSAAGDAALFDRVATILEQARANVVRAVNSNMVLAYWLIGREIVQEIQGGGKRAAYGDKLLDSLSKRLTERYGRGFSTSNLRYFRSFYRTYSDRIPEIRQIGSGELTRKECQATTADVVEDLSIAVESYNAPRGFSPILGWSHYQALLGVSQPTERLFYEIEAEKEGWDVNHLKRQIHTWLFARLLKSRDKAGVMALAKKGHEVLQPVDAISHLVSYLRFRVTLASPSLPAPMATSGRGTAARALPVFPTAAAVGRSLSLSAASSASSAPRRFASAKSIPCLSPTR
jgi:hypothetical protein